ncbi:MAG: hypothetical protein H0U49_10750 [Parachlamydiaceae bacterium]|nr:hypothetical protein [Parachlamydiaceae bacterium]
MSIALLPSGSFQVYPCNDIFKTQEKIAYANSLIQKCLRIAYTILSIIVIPLGIARLTVYIVSKIAPSNIIPGIGLYNLDVLLAKFKTKPTETLQDEIQYLQHLHHFRDQFIADPTNKAKQVTITTADGVELDACSITSPSQAPAGVQKWIVYFHGHKSCYEGQMSELKLIAVKTGANVLSANYRGIMRSKGTPSCSHDLVLDGEAQIQYLLSLGVAKENILLHGWSLGGAVATEVASNHQEKGHEINLCNERSYANLIELLKTRLPKIFGSTIKNIIGFSAGIFLHAAGWQFDGVKNFQKINGQKWIIYSKEDGFSKYSASLYKGLKEAMMTKDDRNIKKQRVKSRNTSGKPKIKDYDQYYKPKNTHNLSYAQNRNRADIVKKNGIAIHCKPISATKEVFERYVLQAKAALKIKTTLSTFQTFKSYLEYLLPF